MSAPSDKRAGAIGGLVAGGFMVASAFTHGFGGWPNLEGALVRAGVEAAHVGSLRVGWWFGSAAMVALGAITIVQSLSALRGGPVSRPTVSVVALMYMAFGAWAFVVRDFNPFFLMFIATGLLVLPLLRVPDRIDRPRGL